MIETPIMEGTTIVRNKEGCQQGSIVSPILANIFLHYVIDSWFEKISKENLKGKAGAVRYCDDMVFVFEKEEEAKKFYDVLPKRLNKFGLEINEAKSQIIKSGRYHAEELAKQGKKIPSYNFLGFTCYWDKSRFGTTWRLKYTTRKDRFTEKLKGLRRYLRRNLNKRQKAEILERVIKGIRGWINYHGISDNQRRVSISTVIRPVISTLIRPPKMFKNLLKDIIVFQFFNPFYYSFFPIYFSLFLFIFCNLL